MTPLLSATRLTPRQLLVILIIGLILLAALSLGSYALPPEALTGRRGPVAFIPRDYRQSFVALRLRLGLAAAAGIVLAGADLLSTPAWRPLPPAGQFRGPARSLIEWLAGP